MLQQIKYFIYILILSNLLFATCAKAQLKIKIAMVSIDEKPHIPLTLIDLPIINPAVLGALMAVNENNRTGKFTGQTIEFEQHIISKDNSLSKILDDLLIRNVRMIVADLPKSYLIELADKVKKQGLIFNIRASDNELRNKECRANTLHITPSRAMKTDALAQYLMWKRWNKWLIIVGQQSQDKAFYKSIKRSAKRFNGKIVEVKQWTFEPGARRTDSGHVLAQQEVPVGTRGKKHQVLIVADEADEFGEYLQYRTDQPRPVVGTQGLIPTSWHRSHEQWGGTQLQRRFYKSAGRNMQARDYAAWLAINSIGEAVTREKTSDYNKIRLFLLSDKFKLAAFKGVPLSFRNWNGQMRQPILLTSARMLVSVSPQDGYLHQHSTLDTLGYDRLESSCVAFNP